MNIFEELSTLYDEIDNFYATKEFEARAKGFHIKESRWRRKRELNDHAYFLFMFTRLEDRIRGQSSKLIKSRQSDIRNWRTRSAWDILPKEKDSTEIPFGKRVALLIKKGLHDYKIIMDYYKLRNTIAHGGNFTTPISIPSVLDEMERLYRILKV